MADDLKILSSFPNHWMKTMSRITYNGYRLQVKHVDQRCETQNSGVMVNSVIDEGDNIAYYGILTEIIELIYPERRSVILFECDWVDPVRGIKQDEYGFTLGNLKSHWRKNEPYVLASQVVQVYQNRRRKIGMW